MTKEKKVEETVWKNTKQDKDLQKVPGNGMRMIGNRCSHFEDGPIKITIWKPEGKNG